MYARAPMSMEQYEKARVWDNTSKYAIIESQRFDKSDKKFSKAQGITKHLNFLPPSHLQSLEVVLIH